MRTNLWPALLVAMAIPAFPVFPAVAAAASAVSADLGPSGGLPPNPSYDVSIPGQVSDASPIGWAPARPGLSPAASRAGDVDYLRRVYGPRVRRPYDYGSPGAAIPIGIQIHAGLYDPFDNFSTGFNGGFRIGPQPDPHFQFGLGLDWWHRSQNEVLNLGTVEAPGGSASEQLILSQFSANLVPILAFVQVNGDQRMPITPYGGFGVGYEWLFLTAHDYVTHGSFDRTFGGFGWQAWAGGSLRLDPQVSVNGELFYNDCEVGTEVDANIPGYGPSTVRDVISVNGLGMRLGVSWRF